MIESLFEPVLRVVQYALLLGLFGWSAFWLLGLRSVDGLKADRAPAFAVLAALVAPVVSAALMLMSIAAMMGVPVAELDRPMIEAMIFGTDIGFAFIVRSGLLFAGLAAILALRNRRVALALLWQISADHSSPSFTAVRACWRRRLAELGQDCLPDGR